MSKKKLSPRARRGPREWPPDDGTHFFARANTVSWYCRVRGCSYTRKAPRYACPLCPTHGSEFACGGEKGLVWVRVKNRR